MMGRMHCVVPVGIAASLYGPDPGPIIVAGSAGVLPDIDEIKSHRGIGCGRCRYDGHVLSFGADMDPGGDERLDLPSCARCSIRWYPVMVAICSGVRNIGGRSPIGKCLDCWITHTCSLDWCH